jgi:hypothetical protein
MEFTVDSPNALLSRVVTLEEQVQVLAAQVEAMREVLAALTAQVEATREELSAVRQGQGGLFHRTDDTEVVTVQVARDGDRVMYIPDKENPNIHHDVPVDRFLGRITKIELQEGIVKGKPITYVVPHMKNEDSPPGLPKLVRLRLGNTGTPSGAIKSFLDNISRISDENLVKNVIFWPYPGTDDSVTMVSILDPETGKSFPYPEGRKKADWKNNDAYWQDLLAKTVSRIDAIARINNPANEGTRSKPSPAPSKPKTTVPTPARSPAPQQPPAITGKAVHLVGTLQFKGDELVQWQDEENPRVTRSSLYLFIRNKDGKSIPCSILDGLAVKVSSMYHPNQRVDCTGTMEVDSNGKEYVLVETLEPFVTDESTDFESLIAESDYLMAQAGWTKQEGRDYLKETYRKTSRLKLTEEELQRFISHLRRLATPTTA